MKKHLPILVSVVLALTAGTLVYVSLQAARPSMPVVVAAKNFSVGEKLTADGLAVRRVPPSALPSGAARSLDGVVGKTVIAGPILAGDIVRAEHLSGESSLVAALASFAPPGWVAVELPEGTGMGLAGIRRGDRVDVYADTLITAPNAPGATMLPENAMVKGAVVISTPWTTIEKEKTQKYVIAVPPEQAPVLAQVLVRKKPVALVVTAGEGE